MKFDKVKVGDILYSKADNDLFLYIVNSMDENYRLHLKEIKFYFVSLTKMGVHNIEKDESKVNQDVWDSSKWYYIETKYLDDFAKKNIFDFIFTKKYSVRNRR